MTTLLLSKYSTYLILTDELLLYKGRDICEYSLYDNFIYFYSIYDHDKNHTKSSKIKHRIEI